ncbi:MAG: YHYH protein [bacterium]
MHRPAALVAALTAAAGLALSAAPAWAMTAPDAGPRATGSPIQLMPKPGVDLADLPLGDAYVSLTGPRAGWTWSCMAGNPNAPGAAKDGPWIQGDTWDITRKIAVSGADAWPGAAYSVAASGSTRTIKTMRVPIVGTTGDFPIESSDPAYEYDRNPNSIKAASKTVTLPKNPAKAAAPSCLPMGAIGVARNGVMLYNALDARGEDARAHEMQDSCEGHPNPNEYHYHAGSACALPTDGGPNSAVLFGYAFDGFGIYVVRDANGDMLTNDDLDACHGRTAKVKWNGKTQRIYHYVVTQEYPYLLGCFTGANGVPPAR